MIFVSFGKVHSANFFDRINFEKFLLIKLYIQNLKNWERGSKIKELLNTLVNIPSPSRNRIHLDFREFLFVIFRIFDRFYNVKSWGGIQLHCTGYSGWPTRLKKIGLNGLDKNFTYILLKIF